MPLGVPDRLVGEVGDAALEGLGVEEAHGFLVAGLAGQALAGPEGDREDLQPQLVDQVMLDQRAYELKAADDDDVPVYLLLQRRDLVKHVVLEDCRVVPGGIGEGRRHDVLGQAVQPVRQLTAARWPPRGEPLVASPAQQEGPGGQRLVERELGKLRAISDQADPAAASKLSSPAGSWMTPSSVTFSLTTIFPISVRRLAGAAGPRRWRRALRACRASRSSRSRSPARRASSWMALMRYSWMNMVCSSF